MRSDEEDCEISRMSDAASMRRAPQPQPRTLNRPLRSTIRRRLSTRRQGSGQDGRRSGRLSVGRGLRARRLDGVLNRRHDHRREQGRKGHPDDDAEYHDVLPESRGFAAHVFNLRRNFVQGIDRSQRPLRRTNALARVLRSVPGFRARGAGADAGQHMRVHWVYAASNASGPSCGRARIRTRRADACLPAVHRCDNRAPHASLRGNREKERRRWRSTENNGRRCSGG